MMNEFLKDSEAILRSLIQKIPTVVLFLSPDAILIDLNTEAERIYGCRKEEVIGKNYLELFIPETERETVFAEIKNVLEGKQTRNFENSIRCADGNERILSLNANRITDDFGNTKGIIVIAHDITKIKDNEKRLAGLRIAIDAANMLLWQMNIKTNQFYFSNNFWKFFGIPEDKNYNNLNDLILVVHQDDRQHILQTITESFKSGNGFEAEFRGNTQDEKKQWFYIKGSISSDQYGSTSRIFGIILNISERKQAEENLRLQSKIVSSMSEGVNVVRICDSLLVYTNPKFDEMFGYDAGELAGKHVSVLNAPTDDKTPEETAKEIKESVIRTGKWEGEVCNIRKDGTKFWCLSTVSKFNHPEHGDTLISVQSDITERKQVEKAFRESSRFSQQIIKSAHEGIIVFDRNFRYQSWNPYMEKLTGVPAKEVLGKHPLEVFPFLGNTGVIEILEKALAGETPPSVEFEYKIQQTGNSGWALSTRTPLWNTEGEIIGILGTVRDITERKLSEQALKESKKELEFVMNSISDFIWSAETDINGNIISLYFSPVVEKITGYPINYFSADPNTWLTIVHPADRTRVREASVRKNKDILFNKNEQYRIIKKDGSIRWVRDSVRYMKIDNGNKRLFGIISDITEMKEAEESVKISEERFRLALTATRMLSWDRNLTSNKFTFSENFWKFFGFPDHYDYSDSDNFMLAIHPDDQHLVMNALNQTVKTGKAFETEFRGPIRNDKQQWYSSKGQIYYDTNGTPSKIAGVTMNITERKLTEQALIKSEEKFRKLAESANDGVIIMDNDANILFWNKAAEEIFGYAKEEVIGKKISPLLIREEYHQSFTNRFNNFRKTGDGPLIDRTFQKNIVRRDGTSLWIDISIFAIDVEGIWNTIGIIRNVTEQKRAEKMLRASEGKYRQIVETAREGIWVLDTQMRTTYVNKQMIDMLGYSEKEILGKTIFDFMDNSELHEKKENIEQRNQGLKEIEDLHLLRKDGSDLWCIISISTMLDGNGNFIGSFAMISDITSRKEMEGKLSRTMNRLETLSKLLIDSQESERLRIARELHDEIGQSLTALKINFQSVESLNKKGKNITYIKDGIDVIDRLIEKVRDMSLDLRPPMLDDLGLVSALKWCVERTVKRTGIEVIFTTNNINGNLGSEIEIACFRVANEALTNVIRHSKAKKVNIKLYEQDNELHLSVKDDGVGFDRKKIRAKILQRKSLGLLGMEERVFLLKGKIKFESVLNHGTEVHASFPLNTSNNLKE